MRAFSFVLMTLVLLGIIVVSEDCTKCGAIGGLAAALTGLLPFRTGGTNIGTVPPAAPTSRRGGNASTECGSCPFIHVPPLRPTRFNPIPPSHPASPQNGSRIGLGFRGHHGVETLDWVTGLDSLDQPSRLRKEPAWLSAGPPIDGQGFLEFCSRQSWAWAASERHHRQPSQPKSISSSLIPTNLHQAFFMPWQGLRKTWSFPLTESANAWR